jgi:hypothetical protein
MSATSSRLPDLCQCVLTGDPEAITTAEPVLPYLVGPAVNGSLKARYRCAECGRRWAVWWDRRAAGWPELGNAA